LLLSLLIASVLSAAFTRPMRSIDIDDVPFCETVFGF
jgi:hypothetical protein